MRVHVSPVPTHTQLVGRVLGVTGTSSLLSGIGEKTSRQPPSPPLDEETKTLRGREEPRVPPSNSISALPSH